MNLHSGSGEIDVGYAEHNLISGETITYRGRVHWTALVTSVVPMMVIDILAMALIIAALSREHEYRGPLLIAALVLFIISGIVVFAGVLSRRAAEFVITNKRIIAKVGVLQKQTVEIFLNKIESVGVDQNLRGRMLGYGSIALRGTGGSIEMFHRIADPFEFRRQVQEQIGSMNEPVMVSK
jgi:uncharacterized membrane protein YdbT with pleckstrin-like domain